MATHNLIIGADVQRAVAELQKLNGFTAGWASQMRGAMMSAFSFYGIYQGLRQTVSAMAEFQAEMSKLKALTGETGARLDQLKENALGLAGAFKSIDIARAQTDLSRAGFSTDEINNSIEAIINLATATGEELPKSAEIASATLRGFQMDSKEMTRVTDVMAGSFNKTALDLASFSEAMKYVAPNAHAANVSLEETTAMLGVLANNGIKGSMAGTSLRRIFQDLSKDGRPVAERLEELGASGLSAADAMEEIGRIGSTSLLILANSVPQVNELNKALHNVEGATDRMAGTMMDNLAGDWKELGAAWDTAIQKGTWLSEILRNITARGTTMIQVFTGQKLNQVFGPGGVLMPFGTSLPPGEHGPTLDPNSPFGRIVGGKKDLFTPDPSMFAQPKRSDAFGGDWVSRQIESFEMIGKMMPNWNDLMKEAGIESQAYADATFEVNKQLQLAENLFESAGSEVGSLTEDIGEQSPYIDSLVESYGKLQKSLVKVEMTGRQMANSLRMAITGVFSNIGRVIANALEGGNMEAALLGFLGGIATQVGEMAVGIGVALLGIEMALKSMNPWAAIGAGVALIALGTYASNRAAEIGSQVNSGGGGSMPRWADRDVSIKGDWRIRGNDLVYVLDKQGYRTGVVGG